MSEQSGKNGNRNPKKSGKNESSMLRLRRELYSRTPKRLGVFQRRQLRQEEREDVPKSWQASPPRPSRITPNNTRPILKVLLITAISFFVFSALLAAFFFFRGSTTVSSSNIDIEIQGPATVGGGDELTLQISVTNRNATPIETASLLIEYPGGTRAVSDISTELPRARESLGTIDPGQRVETTARAILFGEEGSDVSVNTTLEYRVPGSNAIFFKEQVYDLVLSTAPLAIILDAVQEVTSGQEVEFDITVVSNSDSVIEDVLLAIDYPFGFQFSDSQPQPAFTNNVWQLGDIGPEEKQTITVRGTVVGENEEERVFRFAAGVQSSVNEEMIETAFTTKLHAITIERPFIGVELALDGSTAPEYVTGSGSRVRGDIRWFNNLPVQVFDGEIKVRIQGAPLDETSVAASGGFYRSIDNTILWSPETKGELRTIQEGGSGTTSFSFETFGLDSGQTFRNPELLIEVTISGRRVSEQNVPETIESTIVRTVRVQSDLLLTSRAVYTTGPFTNTGPIPPKAEQPTTYTILWTVTNSHNAVSNAEVRATLPSYMRFLNNVSPQNASLTFNDIGGEIVWKIDQIDPGGKRDLAFQVEFTPSISQVDTEPVLINTQKLTGTDSFTRTTVSVTQSALTTDLSTDPGVSPRHDIVIP